MSVKNEPKFPIELHPLVQKLVGAIEPVGQTEVDELRLLNLIDHMGLLDKMVQAAISVSRNANSHEGSVKEAGQYAKAALENIKDDIERAFE